MTLAKVSDDLFQSEEIQMPKSNGPFEGQLVVGDDVLSVSPFTIPTGGLITLYVTSMCFLIMHFLFIIFYLRLVNHTTAKSSTYLQVT